MLECEAMCEDADVEYENACESLHNDFYDSENDWLGSIE